MIPFNVILDNNILQTHFNRYPGSPRHNWQSFHYSRYLFTSEPSQPSETLSNDKCCWTDRLPLLRCLPGEGGDWRGQVASAALSQDRGHNHGHNSPLSAADWWRLGKCLFSPGVPQCAPSPLLWVSTLVTVGNFTLGPQPPATSRQPPHDTSSAFCYPGPATELGTSTIGILLLQSTVLYCEDSVDIP